MRRASVVVSASLLFAGLLPVAARACFNLQPAPGEFGYQHRLSPDRCEGLFQAMVAGEKLEFLSLISGKIKYDVVSDKALILTVPDVSPLQATQVVVQARAIPLGTYYRMDATLETGASMRWPLSTVIAPIGLPADTLGVVAWINKGITKVFVPVSVREESAPRTGTKPLIMILRSPVDVERLKWRSWPEGYGTQTAAWQTIEGDKRQTIRAGEPISVALSGKSSAVLIVEIAATTANSDRPTKLQIKVFMP